MKILNLILVMMLFGMTQMNAQKLEGTWVQKGQNATLIFSSDQVIPRTYVFIDQNGTEHKNEFWTRGTTLYLKYFAGGGDASFEIKGMDANNLYLASSYSESEQYHLVRKGAASQVAAPDVMASNNKVQPFAHLNVNSNKVLATKNGYNYTEGDLDKGVRFGEFILNRKLTSLERRLAQQEALQGFNANPAQTLQGVQQVNNEMEQVLQIKDALQIGVLRNVFVSVLTRNFQQTTERPLLRTLMEKDIQVLAAGNDGQLVLTKDDVEGLFDFVSLMSRMSGQSAVVSQAEKIQATQQLVQAFPSASLQDQQSICSMRALHDLMKANYDNMDAQQREQLKQRLVASNEPSTNSSNGMSEEAKNWAKSRKPGMDWNTYNAMSNMSMMNHAGMMNSIEAIGGTGNYWYVK